MNIYVAGPIPEPGPGMLRSSGHAVKFCAREKGPERGELLDNLRDAHGVLALLSSRIDSEALAAAPRLKVVSNYAVGFDNVDVAEATRRGIAVTNTPGVLTDATAELAVALMFCAARRISESERFARAGKFTGWSPNLFHGVLVTGKTLGIAGAGRIGTAVARRCKGLGMGIIYFDESESAELTKQTGARRVSKAELLAESDFLSLHLPLTAGTRHFLAWNEFRAMKRTAILINTSRGPVVDEKDLARALSEGVIRGAGLDVYEEEPEINSGLKSLENAVLVPHIGSATVETRAKMAEVAAANLLDALSGRKPQFMVNPEVWEK